MLRKSSKVPPVFLGLDLQTYVLNEMIIKPNPLLYWRPARMYVLDTSMLLKSQQHRVVHLHLHILGWHRDSLHHT